MGEQVRRELGRLKAAVEVPRWGEQGRVVREVSTYLPHEVGMSTCHVEEFVS